MRYVPLHIIEMFYINDWKCCMNLSPLSLYKQQKQAINAASQAIDKARKKESNILKNASENTVDPSKMQLSRALAMLVLRKNLPSA